MQDEFEKRNEYNQNASDKEYSAEEGAVGSVREEEPAAGTAADESAGAPQQSAESANAAQANTVGTGYGAYAPRYAAGNPWNNPYQGAPMQSAPQGGSVWNGSEYAYRPQQGVPYAQGQPFAPGNPAYPTHQVPQRPQDPPKAKKQRGMSAGAVAALIIVCMILSCAAGFGGAVLAGRYFPSEAPTQTQGGSGTTYTSVPSNENLGSTDYAISNVVKAVADSVVEITTENISYNPIFGEYITGGAGSGVIISTDGYVVTCAHVIDGADTVTVKLTNSMSYTAKVIGSDTQTDIALLKIEADDLTVAVIGDSSALAVGDPVVAIGNPLGELGGSVTDGIISALQRQITISGTTYTLLQTNAAVNPGNSGGALFNINGELIGIVNAKEAGDGIEGLAFAIPINGAMNIVEQLREFGYVKGRPQFGINLYEVADSSAYYSLKNSEYSALINYVSDYGVYFLSYADGQKGDLQFGDRIVAADGISISGTNDLRSVLAEYSIGDTITLTVARITDFKTGRGRMVDVEITLMEAGQQN